MNDSQPLERATADEYASWFKALSDGTRIQGGMHDSQRCRAIVSKGEIRGACNRFSAVGWPNGFNGTIRRRLTRCEFGGDLTAVFGGSTNPEVVCTFWLSVPFRNRDIGNGIGKCGDWQGSGDPYATFIFNMTRE